MSVLPEAASSFAVSVETMMEGYDRTNNVWEVILRTVLLQRQEVLSVFLC